MFGQMNILGLWFISLKLILAFFEFLSFYMILCFVFAYLYFIFPFINYWCELEHRFNPSNAFH